MNVQKKKIKWEVQIPTESTSSSQAPDKIIDLLLKNRGIKTKKERAEFLSPDLKQVTAKEVGIDLRQLKKARLRVERAIKDKEQIIVFGDYDVDGITGAAILWETLYGLGADILPYIPHRTEEGYGLSKKAIDNILLKKPLTKLIITVDNGIVAGEAVTYAKTKGIEVIITDHHLPEGKTNIVDSAYATVHTTKLCGSGVAYLFSKEFKPDKKGNREDDSHLELAALGTFADMMPLTGANRAIAFHGLKILRETKRIGLLALYEEAGIEKEGVSEYAVGHVIVPRLNATGRLESGMDSLRLLCTKDENRAKTLAFEIGKINRERQNVLTSSVIQAIEAVRAADGAEKKIIVLAHADYQEGVIGLIAGRLVEEFYRPAIVISKRIGESKASVRSVSGFNIIEFLRMHKKLFLNVGGHPMAAGFTVTTESIVDLTLLLETSAEKLVSSEMLQKKIKIDMKLDFDTIDDSLYKAISALEPFGMGNPRPVFLTEKVNVLESKTLGKEGNHLKLLLGDGKGIEAIGFGMGNRSPELKDAASLDIVYTIDENEWRGNKKLQLKLRDFSVN